MLEQHYFLITILLGNFDEEKHFQPMKMNGIESQNSSA